MRETLAGLWTSGLWLFGALAAALLLADLIALAFGRRMLNPQRLTDRKYRRLKRLLIFQGVLDKDATYEPRAVGTLAGHWRSIQGWSVIWSAGVGTLLTATTTAATFLIPVPVAGSVDAIGLHLAVGFWLALGMQGFSLLIGNSIGYVVAARRMATLPPDAGDGTTPDAGRETSRRRRRWISPVITVIVIAADAAITRLFGQIAASAPPSVSVELTWLSRLLLAVPPLMVLALALGEVLAVRAHRRRPLLLSPDLALARHANARQREQSAQAFRGFAVTSVGVLAIAQYGTIMVLFLWQVRTPDQSYIPIPLGIELAYLSLYFVCLVVGSFTRTVETYRIQPSPPAATPAPRRA